jgi:hypothetical protein
MFYALNKQRVFFAKEFLDTPKHVVVDVCFFSFFSLFRETMFFFICLARLVMTKLRPENMQDICTLASQMPLFGVV